MGRKPAADRYSIIGPVYDFLSTLYSGRQIYRTKIAMNTGLEEGDTVLFAGAGHGLDALDAARRGAKVTVVDLSATMLEKAARNMEGRTFKYPVRFVHGDILKFEEPGSFDQVVANFFLNVFPESFMAGIMQHLGSLVKPGGRFVVGDFHYPDGGFLTRAFQHIYWYIAVLPFAAFAGNAIHPIYNYPAYIRKMGFQIKEIKSFSVLAAPLLWSIKSIKKGGADA